MISIAEALTTAAQVLSSAGVPEARREAGSLLSFILGKDRTFLISHAEDQLSDDSLRRFREGVERRASGEPLQYITGVQDFFGREFRVTPDVLIPRPETELLVEAAIEVVGDSCALFAMSEQDPGALPLRFCANCVMRVRLRLISRRPALEIAKLNARNHAVLDRIDFAISDCFSALDAGQYQFDMVVSNPPYVSAEMMAGLQREVRDHEPLVALSPGPDGLSVIRRLIVEAPAFLKNEGHLIMEIGFDQSEAVKELVDEGVWHLREIKPDLQSIPRIVVLQKR